MPIEAPEVTWDIFLAHSGLDKQEAERLFDLLQPSGYSVFLDSKCLRPWDDWDIELPKAQGGSRITIALISTRTEEAYYLRQEIAAAIVQSRQDEDRHRVIPIYLEKMSPPYAFNTKQGISVPEEGGLENVAKRLVEHIKEFLPDRRQSRTAKSQTFSFSQGTSTNSLWYCTDGEVSSHNCRRFQALLDCSYLFICLDQLESGAWGTSVAFWMNEVGKGTPGFRLQNEMVSEGGMETTAFCAQALAGILPGENISNKAWATKCRNYFRERQKRDGSFGYKRRPVRAFRHEIESTYRHTSQAIFALMSLSDLSINLLHPAFKYLFDALLANDSHDPSTIAKNAQEKEKYPAMLISALLYSMHIMEKDAPWLVNDLVSLKVIPDFDKTRKALLESLAFLDRDRDPFFMPYGRFEEMQWYSFLSVLNLLAGQNLQYIKNRLNDGISRLLDESESHDGLRFWENGDMVDFGLTALFLKVLSIDSVSDMLTPYLSNRTEVARKRLFQWLLSNFDTYTTSPSNFSYTSSGTLAQIFCQHKCQHIDCSSRRLANLDKIVQAIKVTGLRGAERINHMTKLLDQWFDGAGIDRKAMANLFEDKLLNIHRAFEGAKGAAH